MGRSRNFLLISFSYCKHRSHLQQHILSTDVRCSCLSLLLSLQLLAVPAAAVQSLRGHFSTNFFLLCSPAPGLGGCFLCSFWKGKSCWSRSYRLQKRCVAGTTYRKLLACSGRIPFLSCINSGKVFFSTLSAQFLPLCCSSVPAPTTAFSFSPGTGRISEEISKAFLI